nr:proline-rich protein 5 isoform X4 [Ovis aries]
MCDTRNPTGCCLFPSVSCSSCDYMSPIVWMEKLRHEQSNLGRGVQPGNPGLGCKLRPALGLEHPQRGDRRLPAQGAAGPGAFQPERRCPAAAEDGAGVLLHGVPTEPAADERHGDPARQDPLLRGTEAAGLAGGDLGLLFQRRAAHPAGGLLPGAGQGAVGAPAGPAALSEHHHPGREARGCAGPGPRPCAPRHRANAAGAAGGARVPGRDEGLPAPGDTDPEEKHYLRRSRSGDVLAKNPVVRSKSYNTPLLNPVAEHEAEGAAAGGAGIRRHSVSEMTSCPEPQGFADTPGPGPAGAFGTSPSSPPSGPCPNRLYPPAQPPKPGPGAARGSPASSSPENLVDQILESVDSDSEGIFIDFGRGGGSGTSEFEGAGGRQSVV